MYIFLKKSSNIVSSPVGHGGQREHLGYGGKISLIYSFLLEARLNYIMRNPTNFLNVQMYYDLDGECSKGLADSIDSKGKILCGLWIIEICFLVSLK